MNYLIWVDDTRPVNPMYETLKKRNPDKLEVLHFTNGLDAMDWLGKHHYDELNKIYVDLDHDLGSYEITGYTICKYIVENSIPLAGFAVHSMNPVGAEKMVKTLLHYGYTPMIYRGDVLK